jgi:23S rRNA pseudouridine2605 synthase
MPFNKNRNSRDDKSGKDQNKSPRSGTSGRPKSGKSFSSDSSSKPGSKSYRNSGAEKKPYGDKKEGGYGSERKSFGDRREGSGDRKPYGDRKEGGYGSERKSFGDRREGSGDRKPYGDRKEGGYGSERKSFGDRREGSGDRKPYGDRKEGGYGSERKSFGDRREGSGDRKPYGDRKEGGYGSERKSFSDRRESSGDRKPYSESFKNFREEGKRPSRPKREASNPNDEFDLGDGAKGKSENHSRPYKKRESENFAPRAAREEGAADENLKLRSRKPNTNFKKESETIRLNRYIANSGICSRRKADELIAAGVVSVNGEVVSELGAKVNPSTDQIRYNGELLKREKMVYVLLNKPKDFITTTDDPQERKTVMELVDKASKERIYPVGRLDRNTTGLLLMTNDGDLAEKLSHPRNNISKIYNVELNRNLTQGDFNKIAFGLELEDGFIKPDSVSYVTGGAKNEIGIQIHSGKNRIVRRIFESLGYEVVKLDRVIYANLSKKDLPRGKWRYLSESEIIQLKHFIK